MTPPRSALDERTVEQLLAGRAAPADADLQHAVTLVRSLGSGPAPQPTLALAQLLEMGFEPEVVPLCRPVPRRTWAVRATAALTAAAASVLVAGTAQALPAPLQNGVADVVSALTPFELPRPDAPEPASGPAAVPADDPSPSPSDVAVPSAPAAAPTADTPEQETEAAEDRTAAAEQERARQRAAEEAAEESQRAAEEAAENAARASEDAAREREDAAREAARAREEAAEEAAEQAERDREDAEDAEDAADPEDSD